MEVEWRARVKGEKWCHVHGVCVNTTTNTCLNKIYAQASREQGEEKLPGGGLFLNWGDDAGL